MNNKLIELAAIYGIKVSENENVLLMRYMDLLLEYNKKFNLTAITEPNDVLEKHFLDSLLIFKNWNSTPGIKVVDIGTGGGLPGIPVAILKPDIDVCLLDSVNKKVQFLEIVKEELGIKNIFPLWSRTEDLTKKARESFDVVTARAVAHLGVLIEYAFPLLKVGGTLIALKGPSIDIEIQESAPALKEFGAQIINIDKISLPTAGERNVVIIKKTKKTSSKYPRNAGLVKKSPFYIKIET